MELLQMQRLDRRDSLTSGKLYVWWKNKDLEFPAGNHYVSTTESDCSVPVI